MVMISAWWTTRSMIAMVVAALRRPDQRSSYPGRLQQLLRPDPQRRRQPVDVQQADIPPAPLAAAHVGPIQAGLVGECFLRRPPGLPQLAQPEPEPDPWV